MKTLFLVFLSLILLSGCQPSQGAGETANAPSETSSEADLTQTKTVPEQTGAGLEQTEGSIALPEPTAQPQEPSYKEIQTELNQMTETDFEHALTEALAGWAQQSELPISDYSLKADLDELLMKETANEREFMNLAASITIFLDLSPLTEGLSIEDKIAKEKEIIAPLATEISMALRNTNCGKYKLRELTTDFFDSQNPDYKYDSSHMSQTLTGVSLAIDLPEEEYQLQTIAYQFAADFNEAEFSDEIYQIGSIPNVTLRRFGILPDSKELFAEISIYSANADPDSLSASLKGRADALYSEISGEEDAVLYLKEQEISSITISFYTPWDRTVDPPYHTFSYQIQ